MSELKLDDANPVRARARRDASKTRSTRLTHAKRESRATKYYEADFADDRRGRIRGVQAGVSEERKGAMSRDVENAKRGFGSGRSRADAFQMRRFVQDSMARLI